MARCGRGLHKWVRRRTYEKDIVRVERQEDDRDSRRRRKKKEEKRKHRELGATSNY
jgi:hypothetical protein